MSNFVLRYFLCRPPLRLSLNSTCFECLRSLSLYDESWSDRCEELEFFLWGGALVAENPTCFVVCFFVDFDVRFDYLSSCLERSNFVLRYFFLRSWDFLLPLNPTCLSCSEDSLSLNLIATLVFRYFLVRFVFPFSLNPTCFFPRSLLLLESSSSEYFLEKSTLVFLYFLWRPDCLLLLKPTCLSSWSRLSLWESSSSCYLRFTLVFRYFLCRCFPESFRSLNETF